MVSDIDQGYITHCIGVEQHPKLDIKYQSGGPWNTNVKVGVRRKKKEEKKIT